MRLSGARSFLLRYIARFGFLGNDSLTGREAFFSEPPMTTSLSKEEILEFLENPMIVPNYLCHTQAVEQIGDRGSRFSYWARSMGWVYAPKNQV